MHSHMAKYAWREVTIIAIIGGGGSIALLWLMPWLAFVGILLTGALLSFYRDPHRTPPRDATAILAPADGRIVDISRNWRATPDGPPLVRIIIFLSVLNVHVNRTPCAGRVRSIKYTPGEFLNALNPASNERNERNEVEIEPLAPLPGPILVRQIAGLLAKRIVCKLTPGSEFRAGERFGMIKLGSRTEIRLPESDRWTIDVAVNQAVCGAETILARFRAA